MCLKAYILIYASVYQHRTCSYKCAEYLADHKSKSTRLQTPQAEQKSVFSWFLHKRIITLQRFSCINQSDFSAFWLKDNVSTNHSLERTTFQIIYCGLILLISYFLLNKLEKKKAAQCRIRDRAKHVSHCKLWIYTLYRVVNLCCCTKQ